LFWLQETWFSLGTAKVCHDKAAMIHMQGGEYRWRFAATKIYPSSEKVEKVVE
jgi:hypothetical protein